MMILTVLSIDYSVFCHFAWREKQNFFTSKFDFISQIINHSNYPILWTHVNKESFFQVSLALVDNSIWEACGGIWHLFIKESVADFLWFQCPFYCLRSYRQMLPNRNIQIKTLRRVSKSCLKWIFVQFRKWHQNTKLAKILILWAGLFKAVLG